MRTATPALHLVEDHAALAVRDVMIEPAPRLIGPGCMTMASGFARASFAAFRPNVRESSRVVDIGTRLQLAWREALAWMRKAS